MLICTKDALVQKARLPEKLVTNTQIVQEDGNTIVVDTGDLEINPDDTIIVDTGHLEQLGLGLHDSIYAATIDWPTPPESVDTDDDSQDDSIQHSAFASLPIRGRANPKGVGVQPDRSGQSDDSRLDDFRQYGVAAK